MRLRFGVAGAPRRRQALSCSTPTDDFVARARSEADDAAQREEAEAEVDHRLPERLARRVGTLGRPGAALPLRELGSDPLGGLRQLSPSVSSAGTTPGRKCRITSSDGGSTPAVKTGASAVGK
jgi:hypothetical protein